MNIKKVIKQHGWTIERLSREMTNRNGSRGITHASASSIINGNPTLDKLVEIASIIGISVSELLADDTDTIKTGIYCPHCGKPIGIDVTVNPR
jgi:transcriptional regulator with XRE-family HTH domain